MGAGLRRTARAHGGIRVVSGGKMTRYKSIKCEKCDGMGSKTDEISGQPLLCLDCDCTGMMLVPDWEKPK